MALCTDALVVVGGSAEMTGGYNNIKTVTYPIELIDFIYLV